MKLSEIKGEAALDVLAEIVEPATEIMSDKEIEKISKAELPKVMILKPILKNHKKAIIQIMAALEMQTPEEFEKNLNVLSLPKKLLELLDDDELMRLFQSQGQKTEDESSGSVSEISEGEA